MRMFKITACVPSQTRIRHSENSKHLFYQFPMTGFGNSSEL